MRPVTTPPSSSPHLRVLPASTTGPHEAVASATVALLIPAELVVVARVAAVSVGGLILNLVWLAAH